MAMTQVTSTNCPLGFGLSRQVRPEAPTLVLLMMRILCGLLKSHPKESVEEVRRELVKVNEVVQEKMNVLRNEKEASDVTWTLANTCENTRVKFAVKVEVRESMSSSSLLIIY